MLSEDLRDYATVQLIQHGRRGFAVLLWALRIIHWAALALELAAIVLLSAFLVSRERIPYIASIGAVQYLRELIQLRRIPVVENAPHANCFRVCLLMVIQMALPPIRECFEKRECARLADGLKKLGISSPESVARAFYREATDFTDEQIDFKLCFSKVLALFPAPIARLVDGLYSGSHRVLKEYLQLPETADLPKIVSTWGPVWASQSAADTIG